LSRQNEEIKYLFALANESTDKLFALANESTDNFSSDPMTEHSASVRWHHAGGDFLQKEYSRDHLILFPNGKTIEGSAAASYGGNPSYVDPEASFTASLSSCHMLTFLALCAVKGLIVKDYADDAIGYLDKNLEGRMCMTRVKLRPSVRFEGEEPDAEQLAMLHDRAHRACFISNSVKTAIEIEPRVFMDNTVRDRS
jgi:organic hydroperoxide reductase OsmC/OhrA